MNLDKLYRLNNARHYQSVQDDAHRLIETAINRHPGNVAVAVSGGKDSVPLAHLVTQHCDPIIIWNDSGLELPESRDVVTALSQKLHCPLVIASGQAKKVWAENRGLDNARIVDRETILKPTQKALKEHNIALEFVGLREDEARGRKIIIRTHGGILENKKWDVVTAWPMRKWKAADCLAYIDEHALPLHPAYSRKFGKSREDIRVSWVYDGTWRNHGSEEYCRRFYPEIYRELREIGLI